MANSSRKESPLYEEVGKPEASFVYAQNIVYGQSIALPQPSLPPPPPPLQERYKVTHPKGIVDVPVNDDPYLMMLCSAYTMESDITKSACT